MHFCDKDVGCGLFCFMLGMLLSLSHVALFAVQNLLL